MELFTVSNVTKGSDRLWVHFSCLCFISFYIVYLLHEKKDTESWEEVAMEMLYMDEDMMVFCVHTSPTSECRGSARGSTAPAAAALSSGVARCSPTPTASSTTPRSSSRSAARTTSTLPSSLPLATSAI